MKLRKVGTLAAAIKDTIDILGAEGVAIVCECSPGHAYRLSDPDYDGQPLSYGKAVDLDVACARESGRTPFMDMHRRKLDYALGRDEERPASDVETALLSANAAIGQLNAAVRDARRPESEGGTHFSKNERARILLIEREIRQQLDDIVSVMEGQ